MYGRLVRVALGLALTSSLLCAGASQVRGTEPAGPAALADWHPWRGPVRAPSYIAAFDS